ncbi:ribbon-helix-helix protein, CopG family [Agrobacterium sp. SHOUNA12C]|uniref:CopG family ribbon-helix-helix protein n=1 Tax=Rhizobium rhizogenes TaxID=359 RepID=UPI0005579873|nr:ribbon-helix-helix protein, CopG family [Rhizobium rhizogenes]MCJ9723067.1 ribbon-helix-helix protein, CopG family [Agrobacterium sp. BETTINA12B]MCJ9758443.1 ribbon-helix-helix protein, CopG family [Agrobacterium sp. SHOUNA12C]MQB29852.1 ribbon-helix-helix protein, CopG family [Rhizobium rhizogenes]NTF68331.1 ribbon-helix-helix protein, CopG family [Rhizobium rhizogenes]NTG46899.1 ribbon-helix-helix protein, CopG family [Rhizobium rhizogenes]
MKNQSGLSDPITLRVPVDILAEIEEIADVCERTRSWVFVRALKSYLAAEGREVLEIAKARRDMANGEAYDLDDVISEVAKVVKGAAA